ncbi:MAG: hypothetical protein MJE66_01990 [Proteobacteria bacterium]|nr:hypothetical protein [Pseudomonadota bacterium]
MTPAIETAADSTDRVAIIVSNYNMPEMADYLAEYIGRNVRWPYDLIVVDNGSDKVAPSKHTTIHLSPNLGPNAAWQVAFTVCDRLERRRGRPFFAYFLCCTNTLFPVEEDILTPLAQFLRENDRAVGVNPAHTPDSGTPFADHFDTGTGKPRRVRLLEWTTGLYRADWMKRVGRLDPAFYYNWGLDVDLSVKAKLTRRTLWIHEGVRTTKQSDVGYDTGRYEMTATERHEASMAEMDRVFAQRYGRRFKQLRRALYASEISWESLRLRLGWHARRWRAEPNTPRGSFG